MEYISHGKNTAVETEESVEDTPKEKESHPEFLTNFSKEIIKNAKTFGINTNEQKKN